MGYISVIATVVLLCLAANTFSAEIEENYGLTEPINLEELPKLSGTLVAATNFNGFSAVGISGALVSQEAQPTIFHKGRWFASVSAASVYTNLLPNSQPGYYGRGSIGMFGQMLPNSTLKYIWSVNSLFWDGSGSDFRAGVYDNFNEDLVLGANVGRTFDSPQGSVNFANVYANYNIRQDLQLNVEQGFQQAGEVNEYNYTTVGLTKIWSTEWTTKLAYSHVVDGKAGKKGIVDRELRGHGTRLTINYNF